MGNPRRNVGVLDATRIRTRGGGLHLFDWKFIGDSNVPAEAFLFFQTVFCATAATIVSGGMAERTKFSMYIVISIVISMVIYPVGAVSVHGFCGFLGTVLTGLFAQDKGLFYGGGWTGHIRAW